ncbi:MAG: flagellar hook-basal body complex protein [Oceanospirillaceae bacterium]|nr:flagellar hook-basal body complex protein [Oceanospirillaceae bacterium]MCP5350132.1 flagellar hook-basal body complex protein [Oceanospirillaceae bacterium]
MAFNIGLSGIRAASTDLEVTGNNVANASTIGFKQSRTEFVDVYTTSLLGTGVKPVGSGVMVENVRQQFSQGNISGTENALDMAIDGNGFFVLDDGGQRSYTRAGIFGLDKNGYVVANNGARLQGYAANSDGVVNGVLDDIQILVGNQPPSLTTRISSILNLDARQLVKQEQGQRLLSNGLAIAVPDAGIAESTSSTFDAVGQPTSVGTPPSYLFNVDMTALGTAATAGGESITIDLNDGTTPTAITLNALTGPFATNAEKIAAIINEVQDQIDATFGVHEITVQESATFPGQMEFIRTGFDSTLGTSFTVSATNAAWDTIIGSDGAAIFTPGTAGSKLFVGSNPLKADFRSIPGTSTTTRTVATPPLAMTDFIGGDHAVITSNGGQPSYDFTGKRLNFDIEVTDVLGVTNTYNIALYDDALAPALTDSIQDITGAAINSVTPANLLAVINNQLAAQGATDITVTQSGNELVFTGSGPSNGDTVVLVEQTIAGVPPVNLTSMGLSTANRTGIGTPDVLPNNMFRIQVTGTSPSSAFNITIPAANYASLDDLANAIQGEIDIRIGANGLAGKVTVDAVGGQLVFTNTNVGSTEGITFSAHTATYGAQSLTALGFDNMFAVPGTDEVDKTNSFRINLTVPAPDTDGRSGTAVITLDEEYRSVQQLAASINRQLNSLDAESYIGVRAKAVEVEPKVSPPEYTLRLEATVEGEASVISVTDFIATGADVSVEEMYALLQVNPDDNSQFTAGIEGVNNEYPAQKVVLTNPDGEETIIETDAKMEANEIASIYNRQPGLTASASTTLTIPLSGYNNPTNDMTLTVNGQLLESTSLADIADEINSLVGTTMPGFNAEIDDAGDLILTNSIGRDIVVAINSPNATDSLVVRGIDSAGPVVLGGTTTADQAVAVGGTIELILSEGYTLSQPSPAISGLFGALSADEFEPYILNSFDPLDQNTYNHATSTTIYDSLGNSHVMTQFFVKEPADPTRPSEANLWVMYVTIDGANVGDPDPTLPFPENLEPTMARYELFFNADGTLDEVATSDLYITNWDPLDANGDPNGAIGSRNILEGGLPLTDPATSSNFQIVLDGSTQFGSAFSVSELNQNGYTTGRLTGLEVDQDGIIFARYTNGQAQVLGQVSLAIFRNPEGLTPLGDTAWAESYESGVPTIGSPRTGSFGQVKSASLEDSNVDLSEELVGLIIAQRNFQASAKTIETADAVTQTIINI